MKLTALTTSTLPQGQDTYSPPLGAKIADWVTELVGSWKFIIIQSAGLATWITLNCTVLNWDIYPFILLNLALSFQAAYTAPFILMSSARQSAKDRKTLELDLAANVDELERLERIENNLMRHVEQQLDEVKLLLAKPEPAKEPAKPEPKKPEPAKKAEPGKKK